ncbi:hypothetical protein BKA62DRAFT_701896 [Auriculariales sp. MPI-PUGE-AT-0066]|nr:hypothetical protein BKA62DRAFT_701896 [Auriculariales sp. MPI-PUGE-AT-0066]
MRLSLDIRRSISSPRKDQVTIFERLPLELVADIIGRAADELLATNHRYATLRLAMTCRTFYTFVSPILNRTLWVTYSNAKSILEVFATSSTVQIGPLAEPAITRIIGKVKRLLLIQLFEIVADKFKYFGALEHISGSTASLKRLFGDSKASQLAMTCSETLHSLALWDTSYLFQPPLRLTSLCLIVHASPCVQPLDNVKHWIGHYVASGIRLSHLALEMRNSCPRQPIITGLTPSTALPAAINWFKELVEIALRVLVPGNEGVLAIRLFQDAAHDYATNAALDEACRQLSTELCHRAPKFSIWRDTRQIFDDEYEFDLSKNDLASGKTVWGEARLLKLSE